MTGAMVEEQRLTAVPVVKVRLDDVTKSCLKTKIGGVR